MAELISVVGDVHSKCHHKLVSPQQDFVKIDGKLINVDGATCQCGSVCPKGSSFMTINGKNLCRNNDYLTDCPWTDIPDPGVIIVTEQDWYTSE